MAWDQLPRHPVPRGLLLALGVLWALPVSLVGLLAGVFSGDVHMASGMLIHQLSVLVVIANAMRLLRTPRRPGGGKGRPVPADGALAPATA